MTIENIAIISGLYDAFARGDVDDVSGRMSPDIIWNEAENFPYADGNPYIGPQAIAEGVFGRIMNDWDGFGVVVEEMFSAENIVVALGRYVGIYKATGRTQNTQMAHIWRLSGGKIVAFQQHADTLHVAQVMGSI